eukprot:CAMPEP_0198731158 /NCGR_PEP_ID=MMETSP1475-20131203/28435_1 /TAXON_ID= ORGANISM="Unidentified sp., Strain CCMP1999" /NCGR_SAMPLE_ID=MMETSP1475 /ASSEMBLY_ACC=CAM_ASM_001111 /LENGTH=397 /DNA_ID=CAMNT_0044494085 /DNA_START=10 /DNA_END=1203 /DNA_ORIENTATION=+
MAEIGSIVRIRFMTYSQNKSSNSVLAYESSPGTVIMTHVREGDGRHNIVTHLVVDSKSRQATVVSTGVDRRCCDVCAQREVPCSCGSVLDGDIYDAMRGCRQKLFIQDDHILGVFGNNYTKSWLQGSWTIEAGAMPPFVLALQCHTEGEVFDAALVSVLQAEISAVHPPRSTARFVTEASRQLQDALASGTGRLSQVSIDEGTWSTSPTGIGSNASSLQHSGSYSPATDDVSQQLSESLSGQNISFNSAVLSECTAATDDSRKSRPSASTGRQIVCGVCNVEFRRNYDLKRHMVSVHEKRKDYVCSLCKKGFSQTGHLNEHIRVTHGGDTAHRCPICDKPFGAKSKLDRHVRTVHDNARLFTCDLCNKSYKEKSYLKHHKMTQHGVPADPTAALGSV